MFEVVKRRGPGKCLRHKYWEKHNCLNYCRSFRVLFIAGIHRLFSLLPVFMEENSGQMTHTIVLQVGKLY